MKKIILNRFRAQMKNSRAELLKKQEEIVIQHLPHTPTYDSEKEADLNEGSLENGPLRTIRTSKNIKNYSKMIIGDKPLSQFDNKIEQINESFVQSPPRKIQALEYQHNQKNSETKEANLVEQDEQSIKTNVDKEWIMHKTTIICNKLPNNAFSSYCYLESLRKEKEIRQQKCEKGYESVDEFLERFPY